jgi:hypothetical protein
MRCKVKSQDRSVLLVALKYRGLLVSFDDIVLLEEIWPCKL